MDGAALVPALLFKVVVQTGQRLNRLPGMLNPLRSEREAFRFLVYVAVVFAVIIAVVLVARAL